MWPFQGTETEKRTFAHSVEGPEGRDWACAAAQIVMNTQAARQEDWDREGGVAQTVKIGV